MSSIETIKYHFADCKKRILFTYRSLVNIKKLQAFLNSLPKIRKENTLPILEISRINGEFTCNLERYLQNGQKDYRVLEYQVAEEDVDNKDFFNPELDCNTTAYNIYVMWEEASEIAKYISAMYSRHKISFNIDFSFIYSLISEVCKKEEEQKELFQKFKDCFTFVEEDQLSFEELKLILVASEHHQLKLQNEASYLKKAIEIGLKNYSFFHPDEKMEKEASKLIPIPPKENFFLENLKKETTPFSNYIRNLAENETIEKDSFYLKVLTDEGDLCTYKVKISFPTLCEFMSKLNQNYKVAKEKVFEELDWDCYQNKPILNQVLPEEIVKSNGYRILNYSVKEEDIQIRKQKAKNVYVMWEENPDLNLFINRIIESLIKNEDIEWSYLTQVFNELPFDEQTKNNIYNAFFTCFQFGRPIDIMPYTIISGIENFASHHSIKLQKAKHILVREKEIGQKNREFFQWVLERGAVSFPLHLILKEDLNNK